jgi:hypothetical protein
MLCVYKLYVIHIRLNWSAKDMVLTPYSLTSNLSMKLVEIFHLLSTFLQCKRRKKKPKRLLVTRICYMIGSCMKRTVVDTG